MLLAGRVNAPGVARQRAVSAEDVAPAPEAELLRAFFGRDPFVITGPPRWNALGLGSTAVFAATLAYNTRRTGDFTFDGRRFLLRRVLFPEDPPPEWFVVDLLQHHEMAGTALAELKERLTATLRERRWNRERLREMADRYGKKATLALVERCISGAGPISSTAVVPDVGLAVVAPLTGLA